jgi:hypothetical protein
MLTAGQRLPLRRLVQSPRRTIAVMELAAAAHVLVMGVESESRLGRGARTGC